MRRRSPGVCDAGAKGCRRANSGQVIGSISAAALSFIVQEPSGIMPRSNAISLSANDRRYRIISVSVRYRVNAGCVRNSDVLLAISDLTGSADVTPKACSTAETWLSVVASSQDTDT